MLGGNVLPTPDGVDDAMDPGPLEVKSTGPPDLRLLVLNRAENVSLVRQALHGLATAVRLDEPLVNDMKTAVSEACNNVVLHAYDGDDGPLELYASPHGNEVEVVVRDRGSGIQPHPVEPEQTMQGVGLALIQALTDRVEFGGGAGEGTEVRMTFSAEEDLFAGTLNGDVPSETAVPPPADVQVSVCGLLVGPVLSSVVSMLAVRGGFSVERLGDVQVLSDSISAHAMAGFLGRHVHLGVDADDGRLDLRLGPLVAEGGRAVVEASAVGGLDPLLERLSDEVAVEPAPGGDGEVLRLTLLAAP